MAEPKTTKVKTGEETRWQKVNQRGGTIAFYALVGAFAIGLGGF